MMGLARRQAHCVGITLGTELAEKCTLTRLYVRQMNASDVRFLHFYKSKLYVSAMRHQQRLPLNGYVVCNASTHLTLYPSPKSG